MRVKELIERLQAFNPEAMIVVDGYEDGVAEPILPQSVKIRLNVHQEDYYGPHQLVGVKEEPSDSVVDAVYLARPDRSFV